MPSVASVKVRGPAAELVVMSDNLKIAAIIPLIITALVAGIGWFIVHELSISRDIKNKRVDLKIKYLIEAYRRLEHVSHRDNPDLKDFESAIADIQLFGTKRQAELARDIALEFAKNRTVSLDPLLADLREDLRKLLHLEHLQGLVRQSLFAGKKDERNLVAKLHGIQ